MKGTMLVLSILLLFSCNSTRVSSRSNIRLLVFSKTSAFRHQSIEAGKLAMLKMGYESDWKVDTSEDASVFIAENLSRYRVVVFLNTSGDILNDEQQVAFQEYIKRGGGFIGIHAASDTEKDWPWYNNLVGAYFKGHPKPQQAKYNVIGKEFPAVSFMPDEFQRFEEIYNFYNFKKELVNVIMTVDEKSYSGGNMGVFHPISWYHNYDGGRAFYTAWGHHPEAYREKLFLEHIAAAIKWAAGKKM